MTDEKGPARMLDGLQLCDDEVAIVRHAAKGHLQSAAGRVQHCVVGCPSSSLDKLTAPGLIRRVPSAALSIA